MPTRALAPLLPAGVSSLTHPVPSALDPQRTAFLRGLGEYTSALLGRQDFARRAGYSFWDTATGVFKRDLYLTLGYLRTLTYALYRARYERGGITERIVEAFPKATWSGGARIVEDTDPVAETPFELAIRQLFTRIDAWSKLRRADVLCQLGHYSAILIGAPGALTSELPKSLRAEDIAFLQPFGQDRAIVQQSDLNTDRNDPRFGLPNFYTVSFSGLQIASDSDVISALSPQLGNQKVHWSRIIHVVEDPLDNDLYGKPCLRAVWNYLDDLDKIVGGGAEAAWKRMDPGMQVDVDPEMPFPAGEQQALSEEITEYLNGLRRVLRTRGTKVNLLSTTVAGFGPNADSVIKLISGTKGIPYRILTGSEQGELASVDDRLNWKDRVGERRNTFSTPLVKQLIDRLIERRALPAPIDKQRGYSVLWAEIGEIDDRAKADIVAKITAANQAQYIANQPPILSAKEIRQLVYRLGPMDPADIPPSKAELEAQRAKQIGDAQGGAGAGDGGADQRTTTPSPSGEGGQAGQASPGQGNPK